ncbi:MAG: hypothetical protein ACK55Z_29870, partial [bacterium]
SLVLGKMIMLSLSRPVMFLSTHLVFNQNLCSRVHPRKLKRINASNPRIMRKSQTCQRKRLYMAKEKCPNIHARKRRRKRRH